MSDFLRGLARGYLTDWSPVDLVETALNLGLAGGGYLGHKAGLLKQPPELLKGSVGTSEWFAKGTPLEDTGSPEYTKGRTVAALSPVAWSAAGKIAPKIDRARLNAILVPESWLGKYGIKDEGPTGSVLGRLQGDLPGEKYVALPQQANAAATFAERQKAYSRNRDAPLSMLFPEVKGTPLDEAKVLTEAGLPPEHGGYADASKKLAVINEQRLRYFPELGLSTAHHELTHLADAFSGAPAVGSSPGEVSIRDPKVTQGIDTLMKHAPKLAERMLVLMRQGPFDRYKGNAGEIRARVAGASSTSQAPTSAHLRFLNQQESQGLLPSFHFQGPGGKFILPTSELGPGGALVLKRGLGDDLSEIWTKDGKLLGVIPHDHVVGSR